jgi:hypothetical protein
VRDGSNNVCAHACCLVVGAGSKQACTVYPTWEEVRDTDDAPCGAQQTISAISLVELVPLRLETLFTRCCSFSTCFASGLLVRPRRGSALLWPNSNLHDLGQQHGMTEHMALPIHDCDVLQLQFVTLFEFYNIYATARF